MPDGSGVVACPPGGLAFLSDQPLLEADWSQVLQSMAHGWLTPLARGRALELASELRRLERGPSAAAPPPGARQDEAIAWGVAPAPVPPPAPPPGRPPAGWLPPPLWPVANPRLSQHAPPPTVPTLATGAQCSRCRGVCHCAVLRQVPPPSRQSPLRQS